MLSISLLFTACSQDENADTDSLTVNLDSNTTNVSQDENTSDVEQISNDKTDDKTGVDKTDEIDNTELDAIDYSAYSSIIYAYTNALKYGYEIDHLKGYLYSNLIDFNGDGIFELVVARIYEDLVDGSDVYHYNNDNFIGKWTNPVVQVFSLDENGGIRHDAEFPIVYYDGEMKEFLIEYAEVDGETYMVSGGFSFESNQVEKVFWRYTESGFIRVQDFNMVYDDVYADPVDFYINGNFADSEDEFYLEYNKWHEDLTRHYVVAHSEFSNYDEINDLTMEFLSSYPRSNNSGESAVFEDKYFILYEDAPANEHEEMVVELLNSLVKNDYDEMMKDVVDNTLSSINEHIIQYTGLIVEDISTIAETEFGYETVYLAEDVANDPIAQNLDHKTAVNMRVNEVADLEYIEFIGQIPPGHSERWFLLGSNDQENTWNLYNYYTDFFHWGPYGSENPFHVSFLGYHDTIFNSYGYEWPVEIFEYYLTQEELDNVSFYGNDGDECYLIKNIKGGTIKVYETFLDDGFNQTRGDLLYETSDNILYLIANISDIYPDFELVITLYNGLEFNYYPSISLRDGSVNYGNYGAPLDTLNSVVLDHLYMGSYDDYLISQLDLGKDDYLSSFEDEYLAKEQLNVNTIIKGSFTSDYANELLILFQVNTSAHIYGFDRKIYAIYDLDSLELLSQVSVAGDAVMPHVLPTDSGKSVIFTISNMYNQGYITASAFLFEVNALSFSTIDWIDKDDINFEKYFGLNSDVLFTLTDDYLETFDIHYTEEMESTFTLLDTLKWNPSTKIFEPNIN